MAKDRQKPEEQQRALLGTEERNFMLVTLMRASSAFARARQVLTTQHFTIDERWLATLWLCCDEYFDEFNELPSRSALVAKFNARYEEDPESFTDDDLDDADNFIATLYEFPEEDLNERVTFAWLKKFLEDRMVDEIREQFSTPTTPKDLSANLGRWLNQSSQYQALSGKRIPKSFETGWDLHDDSFIDKRTTGFSLFDSFTDGGDAAGESYGLLGPYAGGKTTLGVMLTARRAAIAYEAWGRAGRQGPCGVSFHFTYEEGLGSLRLRALSYLAGIPRKTLELALEARSYDSLSRTTNLKRYEEIKNQRRLQRGEPIYGEYERFRSAQRTLNQCWRVVDMTGADEDYPGRGTGMVDEVSAIVRQELVMASHDGEELKADLVLVDYVLACIERHTDDMDSLRHHIRNFPMQMKHKVAIPFKCPAWSMHQLNTQAQALPPGRMPGKTDASEGRAFAERLDFLFAIGNGTSDGLAAFGPVKVRRVKMQAPIVVRLDGDNAIVLDKRLEYSIDAHTGRIMTKAESAAVGGADSTQSGTAEDSPDADEQPPAASPEADDQTPEVRSIGEDQASLRRRNSPLRLRMGAQ